MQKAFLWISIYWWLSLKKSFDALYMSKLFTALYANYTMERRNLIYENITSYLSQAISRTTMGGTRHQRVQTSKQLGWGGLLPQKLISFTHLYTALRSFWLFFLNFVIFSSFLLDFSLFSWFFFVSLNDRGWPPFPPLWCHPWEPLDQTGLFVLIFMHFPYWFWNVTFLKFLKISWKNVGIDSTLHPDLMKRVKLLHVKMITFSSVCHQKYYIRFKSISSIRS